MQVQFSPKQMEKQQMYVHAKTDLRVRKQLEAIAKVSCCKDLLASLCLSLHAGACVTGSKFNVDPAENVWACLLFLQG